MTFDIVALAKAYRAVVSIPEVSAVIPWEDLSPSLQAMYVVKAQQMATKYERNVADAARGQQWSMKESLERAG